MAAETPEEAVARIVAERDGKPPKAPKNAPKDRRLANLKPPWQPGESGNPDGLPPGTVSLTRLLRTKLEEIPSGEERRTFAELLVDATVRDALKGDAAARKLVWEAIEGTARQHIELDAKLDATVGPAAEGTASERLSAALDKIRSRQTPADVQAEADRRIRELQAEHERS
jgi:hypothetical protein